MTLRAKLEQSINDLVDTKTCMALFDDALRAKDEEIARLREQVNSFNRWLSKGVYFTNEEYEQRVAKPKRELLDQAIRFAEMINSNPSPYADGVPEAQAFLTRPDVQARRKKDLPIQCDWDGTGFY